MKRYKWYVYQGMSIKLQYHGNIFHLLRKDVFGIQITFDSIYIYLKNENQHFPISIQMYGNILSTSKKLILNDLKSINLTKKEQKEQKELLEYETYSRMTKWVQKYVVPIFGYLSCSVNKFQKTNDDLGKILGKNPDFPFASETSNGYKIYIWTDNCWLVKDGKKIDLYNSQVFRDRYDLGVARKLVPNFTQNTWTLDSENRIVTSSLPKNSTTKKK